MEWWYALIIPGLFLLVYIFNEGFRDEVEKQKTCRFCASKIPYQATTCKYCAKDLA